MIKWNPYFIFKGNKVPSSILSPSRNKFKKTKNITLKLWQNNYKMIMISFYPKPIESTITPEIFKATEEPTDLRILELH